MEHPISTQALDYFDQLYPLDQSDLQPTVRPMPTVRRSERRTANRENIKMSSELSPAKPSANQALSNAKIAKQDEFYTQYIDIQKEVEAYLEFDCDRFPRRIAFGRGIRYRRRFQATAWNCGRATLGQMVKGARMDR